MAAKRVVLNAKALEALGAERLADLLMKFTEGNAAAKHRLRLELATREGPDDLAREVRNRLMTIARSKSFVDWRGISSLADDLENQCRVIVESLGTVAPGPALDLLWRFMDLARSVFNRCDDSNGVVGSVFRGACTELGNLAQRVAGDPVKLADRAFDAMFANGFGQFDHLIEVLAPALGDEGLEHLKRRMIEASDQPVKRPADKDRVTIGWSSSGPIYEDEMAERMRKSTVNLALKDIADAQGDVDAFIGQYDEETRRVPRIAAEIGKRLLAAGRADEALTMIEGAEPRRPDTWDWPDFQWENVRIDTLEALGRTDDAQKVRWSCFERSLSSSHLKAYLKRLPDFDDLEAEERALAHAERYRDRLSALSFLVSWPALDRAAGLVIEHVEDLDGNNYEILTPAAEALAAKYPLAASLVLRAMIDFSLGKNRTTRYRHAARHLSECARLAGEVGDFGKFEDHKAYEAQLRREHGRKLSFWRLVE